MSCTICDLETSASEPLGGWVVRTEKWSACVAPGFEVPGWLFLQLRRHGEGAWSMDAAEAAEFGVLVAQLSAAIRVATGAERVYLAAYGELFPHFHVLLHPRLPGAPEAERGPSLFAHRERLVALDEAGVMAGAIREALATSEVAEG